MTTTTKQLVFIERNSPTTDVSFEVLFAEGVPALMNNGIRVTEGVPSMDNISLEVNGHVVAKKFRGLSDSRLKSNIHNLDDALNTVKSLLGKSYIYMNETKPSYGFIAQEVETVLPHIVDSDSNGYKMISYNDIIPFLVEAIKELDKKLDIKDLQIETLMKK